MAMGMEMMLKSLGFDPNELKQTAQKFQSDLAAVVQNFNTRLVAIEKQQTAILEQQTVIAQSQLRILDYLSSDVNPAGATTLELMLKGENDGRNGSN